MEYDFIFDTHAHYDDEAFDEDRDKLLSSLYNGMVKRIVDVGASMESSGKSLQLSAEYSYIYSAIGLHPDSVDEATEQNMKWISENASQNKKVVAIGEIGLDYYWKDDNKKEQERCFVEQLNIARKTGLPVIIHSRDAAKDTLDIMKDNKAGEIGGVIHCFGYGTEMAREYLDMGMYIGIGGVVTFKNGRKMKEVVEYTPLDRIVIETDCPYLSPEPYRGKRNDSGRLVYVADEIARIKNVDRDTVINTTCRNAFEMYKI